MTGFSVSGLGLAANVEKRHQSDTGAGMDVLDAAVQIARTTPGGVAALAEMMDMNAGTLQHKLNPNNDRHHLSLKEAVLMQTVSGLPYVLNAMASALGYVPMPSRPDVAEGDALCAFFFLQREYGEFTAAAADALRTGGAVSRNELKRLEYQANEAIAGITSLVHAVAARVPRRDEGPS